MVRFHACFSVVLLAGVPGCSQGLDISESRQPITSSSLSLIAEPDREFDLGAVIDKPGQKVGHDYRLSNATGREIRIVNVVNLKSCCGSVRVGKRRLRPGDVTNVEVSLVVAGKFGPFVHEAEIVTDLPSDPKFVIRTSATAHPAFRVEELTNASNSVLSGRRGLQRVEYEVLAIGTPADPPANLNQLDISSTVDVEWVGVQEQVPCDDGLRVASRRLGVLLDRSGRPEQRRAEIIFRSGDQTLYRQGLRWEVKPSITVSPKVVVMHSDNRKYRALIHASDNAQFRIKRIECDVAGVRVRALGASAAISQTIELGGLPQSRKSQGVAIVFTDHPLQEKVELPFVVIEE